MTVSTTIAKSGPYAGAGTVGPFTVGFRFLQNSHLRVVRTNPDGVDTVLNLTTDYSVSGAGNENGSVTLTSALPVGWKLTILRSVPATQETDYVQNDAFPAESHERALDKLTMIVQQNNETLSRALTVPDSDTATSLVLPSVDNRAGKYLSFDEQGNPVSTTFDVDAIIDASEAAVVAADSAKQSESNAATSAAQAKEQADFVNNQVSAVVPSVIRFSGDGEETIFILPNSPGSENNTQVFINGVYQQKDTYDIEPNELIFTSPPPDGIDNIEVIVAPSVMLAVAAAQDVMFQQAGSGATVRSLLSKARERVTVYDFGAVGDGVADDTFASLLALSSPARTVVFPNGVFNISDSAQDGSPVLISTLPGRKIICEGIITANSRVLRAIGIYGDDSDVQVNIDGNENIATGVSVYGKRCTVHDCNIQDLFVDQFSASGITCSGDSSPIFIRNNIIRNIDAIGDGVLGNGNGLCRGISVSFDVPAIEESVVESNSIYNIRGEEGDAIAVSAFVSGVGYLTTSTTVRDNIIYNFNRRAIKIQSHDNRVINNYIRNTFTEQSEVPNSINVIDFVQGGNQHCKGNTLVDCKFFTQISVFAQAGESFDNFFIEGNTILGLGSETTNAGIFVSTRGSNLVIRDNFVQCGSGTAIAVSNSENVIVERNTTQCVDNATARVLSFTVGVANGTIRDNIHLSGARQCVIGMDSPNVVITGNQNRTNTPLVRNNAGGSNSLILNNIVHGTGFLYNQSNTLVGNQFGQNYNFGDQLNTAPGDLFCGASGPATNLAGVYVSAGQKVYLRTPVAGQKLGWIAMGRGLAQSVTWKEFGSISA